MYVGYKWNMNGLGDTLRCQQNMAACRIMQNHTFNRGCAMVVSMGQINHLQSHSLLWKMHKHGACHEKCKSSFKRIAPVTQNNFDTLWNMLRCQKVPCLPHETSLRNVWNVQKWPLLQPYSPAIVQSSGIVADDRKRFRNVRRTRPQPPTPQGETGTLAMQSRKTRT